MENSIIQEFMIEINDMRFANIDVLYKNKDLVREKMQYLNKNAKEVYKWYFFYQLCILKYPLKSAMWEYINGGNNIEKLEEEYIIFCEKRERLANLTKNR